MSKLNIHLPEILRSAVFAVTLSVPASEPASGAGAVADPCVAALQLDVNASLRGYSAKSDESSLLRLDLPSAGILSVDLAALGSASAEPTLGSASAEPTLVLAGFGCGERWATAEPAVLERSATHLLLAAESSETLLFKIASPDPLTQPSAWKLTTAFAPSSPAQHLPGKEEEDEEQIEIEPDPAVSLGSPAGRSWPAILQQLCLSGEVDDHGDTSTCATFLHPGRPVAGEIGNGWGDDADVFVVHLGRSASAELWRLEVELTSEFASVGRLYDRSGQLLEGGSGDGSGTASLRIARALVPGTYFFRVHGRDGERGAYHLLVDASPW